MVEVTQRQIELTESQFPETLAFVDYWNAKRGQRFAPAWRDIDLMDLPAALIPRAVVADVVDGGRDFKYRFWGTWHLRFHGYEQTGKLTSGLEPPPYRDLIAGQYRQAVTARMPQLFVQRIPIRSSLWVQTELMRFPLSDDGEAITHVLSFESSGDDTRKAHEYFTEGE